MNEAKSVPMERGQDHEHCAPSCQVRGCGMEQNQMTAKENGGEQGTVENDGLGNRSQGTESPSQCGDHFEGD